MPIFTDSIPLSLYIHLPWCVRKCPYCDFNSHEMKDALPETLYVTALMQELDDHLPLISSRPVISIFFGGGTPSLFSAQAIQQILAGITKRMTLLPNAEITLEANPGTMDQARFRDFYAAGINRLSIGIQSLQDEKLKSLGRIHDRESALRAIQIAKEAGFTNFNLDLMYGLPNQSIDDALYDLNTALSFYPSHLSWYQLTIEPNTPFHYQPPVLPTDELIWDMQLAGQNLIQTAGFQQYEVSAYSLPKKACAHNRNYWEFGDYLGIGAGAHSKITDIKTGIVSRFSQVKHPKDYLDSAKRRMHIFKIISEKELIFEFMLNALRLTKGIPVKLFTQRTGLTLSSITAILNDAKTRGLLLKNPARLCASVRGTRFLNELIMLFLA